MKCLGVMSGSSLDGIDVALVDFSLNGEIKWTLKSSQTFPISSELREMLFHIMEKIPDKVVETETLFSLKIAQCINQFLETNNIQSASIDGCAVHGHTVLHYPDRKVSWQLLNAGLVAELTGTTIISDFRNQDIALGGQGTPMAVIADRDLFGGHDVYFNLGGIANVSYKKANEWMAYDLCACNQVLNYYANKEGLTYDEDGRLAQQGKVDQEVLGDWLDYEFFNIDGPKSIDNQWIKTKWIKLIENSKLSNLDSLRTYVELICHLMVKLIQAQHQSIFITGGGAHNTFLINRLRELSPNHVKIQLPKKEIIDFKESILMAFVGSLRLQSKPNFVSSATGASNDSIGGAVYLPSKFDRR